MDQTATDDRTMTPLEAQRARVRAFADSLMETLETLERPKTYIDIERAARAAMMIDRLMVQLYSAPAKATTPSLSLVSPVPSAPSSPVSRLPAASPRPTPQTLDAQDEAADIGDDDAPLMSEAAFAAWEERFTSRFEELIEAKRQGIPLPPEAYEPVEELKARVASLGTLPP